MTVIHKLILMCYHHRVFKRFKIFNMFLSFTIVLYFKII